MELLLDTVNIPSIEKYQKIIPISGVTSNPSIVKKEGKINFFDHLKQIRKIIGTDKTLHVQVVRESTDEIIADAHAILKNVDKDVYIKIPTNKAGLAAMQILKSEGVNITATAIYSTFQGYLAIAAGADYLAPYYNRMVNADIDADLVIRRLAKKIKESGAETKILAASFHTVQQIDSALENGAAAVTFGTDMVDTGLGLATISSAVKDFSSDWYSVYGDLSIPELVN